MTAPLMKLMPLISSLGMRWLVALIEDFRSLSEEGDTCEQVLGALSAPLTAARGSGMPVLIMLDDFPLASHMYESVPGDAPGLISLFEEPMKTALCPHLLTGSPEGVMEAIFTDPSFRGRAERMFLEALPEDTARALFTSLCGKLGVRADNGFAPGFARLFGGNPLYIKNMAKALWKMQKKDASEKDLWEAYFFEVTEGETAFYWTSVLGEYIGDAGSMRHALTFLDQMMKSGREAVDFDKLSRTLGIPGHSLKNAFEALKMTGIIEGIGNRDQAKDNVLKDIIQALSMKMLDGKSNEQIRRQMEEKYCRTNAPKACFEMVIPMASDAELVVAKAFEQIGKNLELDQDLIKQIQLAIIESAINAIEHSGSYEKKVGVKIMSYSGKLEIIIESPGRPFDPDATEEPTIEGKLHSANKRGWGLTLMRKIMDEVKVERIGDKTRVILIKNITSSGVSQ